jgi:adenylate cyclase
MAEGRVDRRLAAILAADVVGYSRLMEQDEAGTMAVLKSRRKEVLQPLVARHHGRIFKFTGDGVLVEFGSAVNAVQCAIDLQYGMNAANAALPEGSRIVLRIGVNLGDVMVEGSDLYGDSVNIAARLEGIAEPGGVLVSGAAFDYVRKKVNAEFEDLGSRTLKNITEAVRVYRVAGKPQVSVEMLVGASNKPSIAVLPFVNVSGGPDQEYFSDGITEDIITELSRCRSFFVISPNSSFHYKGRSSKVQDIGRELGAQYIVEGSVRRAGDRIRVTAQLIETRSGIHLWAERYDRKLDDIFAVQDEIVGTIAATLPGRIEHDRVERAIRMPVGNLAAYDYVLRGSWHLRQYRNRDIEAARSNFERGVALDPSCARALAGLAFCRIFDFFWGNDLDGCRIGLEVGERALALDRDEPWAHWVVGLALVKNRRHDEACRLMERATAISPGSADIAATRGICLVHAGRHDEAIPWLNLAVRLDPFQPDWAWEFLGMAFLLKHRYGEAIVEFGRIVEPPSWICAFIAACHALLGEFGAASQQVAAYHRVLRTEHNGKVSAEENAVQMRMDIENYKHPEDQSLQIEGFRKAGLPI